MRYARQKLKDWQPATISSAWIDNETNVENPYLPNASSLVHWEILSIHAFIFQTAALHKLWYKNVNLCSSSKTYFETQSLI